MAEPRVIDIAPGIHHRHERVERAVATPLESIPEQTEE
jgi:hypothetical protein